MPSSLWFRGVFLSARTHAPKAWAAVEQLIKLLDAADIPVCGGAFGLASEVINMINAVQDTQTECSTLLDLAAQHACSILNFVDAMQLDICDNQNLSVHLARAGIDAFQSDLSRIVPIIRALSRKRRLHRALLRQNMADDIKECELQLKRSHKAFKESVMNTVVATVQQVQRSLSTNQVDEEIDELKIVGAAAVKHHELKNIRPVDLQKDAAGFWTDFVVAEVNKKRSLVKMYYKRTGSKTSFLRDIERFGHCPFGLSQVRAYCLKSSTPFIVFEAESARPLRDHLLDLATHYPVDIADQRIWTTITSLNTAAKFVSQHCQEICLSSLSAALEDARVDQEGQVALAPGWTNTPGSHIGSETGATELTRGILQKLLMGDHAFHRLSCISFTFRAESWNYMTRDDVLKLSDEDAAKAHFCAHADVSLLPSEAHAATKEAYESWTECSCLNHGDAAPPVNQSVIPILSTLANQAPALDLPSHVKNAVSSIIDAMGFETQTFRDDAKQAAQKVATLPPKVWALLLIADGSSRIQISWDAHPLSPAVLKRISAIIAERMASDDYDDWTDDDDDDDDSVPPSMFRSMYTYIAAYL